jgi:hypothetical protein
VQTTRKNTVKTAAAFPGAGIIGVQRVCKLRLKKSEWHAKKVE